MSEALCQVGIYGLTSIGQQLAAHHAANKLRVCVCDEDATFVLQVIEEYRNQWGEDQDEGRASRCMIASANLSELVERLVPPRKIIVFGTYGEDEKFEVLWNELCSFLERGDMVLRWGREEPGNALKYQHFTESIVGTLTKSAKEKEFRLLEMLRLERDRIQAMKSDTPDVFFVGGPHEAYRHFKPLLEPYATIGHVGSSAACAHYAIMVQRAIEFAVTQSFAEGCSLLKDTAFYDNADVGRVLNNWDDSKSRISCYLTGITSRIMYKRDKLSAKGFVTDQILDSVDFQPSDAWVKIEATKFEVPIPTLNAALDARYFSTMKDERVKASKILKAPDLVDTPSVLKEQVCDDLQNAIYCASLCAYAEGLSVLQAASEVESWDVNIETCIELWNLPGSFLASNVLKTIDSALASCIETSSNLLVVPDIAAELDALHMSWRRAVTLSLACGSPVPCLSSALTYYDSYRSHTSPVGIIRAQRDFFGGYGYDRFDREGWFTTNWTREHTEWEKKETRASDEEAGDGKRKRRRKSKPAEPVAPVEPVGTAEQVEPAGLAEPVEQFETFEQAQV